MIRTSEIRNAINSAVDEVESAVGDVLCTLEDAERFAAMDTDEMGKDEIQKLQNAVIDSMNVLRDLKEKLW